MNRNASDLDFYKFIFICSVFFWVNVKAQSSIIPLNENWTVISQNQSVKIPNVQIPNGVYSVLEYAGVTGSLFDSYNDVGLRWVGKQNWTFNTTFNSPVIKSESNYVLTFHGIDTVARVYLNGHLLGATNNMFVRYRYDVKELLSAENEPNYLSVQIMNSVEAASDLSKANSFTPPNCPPQKYNGECHMNFLRKMQASFAWDWGLAAPSSGIWKDVQLEVYQEVIIRDVTVVMTLTESKVWHLKIGVYLENGVKENKISGLLKASLSDIPFKTDSVIINGNTDEKGEYFAEIALSVADSDVELWWPNGFGSQKLYQLTVSFNPESEANEIIQMNQSLKTISIGFRTIELVQNNITDGLSFYFQINGHPIFMKGSNWIPSNILPERAANRATVRHLLGAARDANMNMLRVWGGGVYESDVFYELADEMGILIWQDFMFACAMYPVFDEFLESVKVEIGQNVRRLQHHPSIAVWAGNNENEAALVQNWYGTMKEQNRFKDEYRKLYIKVIKTEVERIDKSREYLSSSPSNGLKTKEEDYISQNPQDNHYGDVHFYNYGSAAWNWSIYPKARFVSEYGFQSFPSLRSWSDSIGGNDNLKSLIDHRQHFPMGNSPITALISANLPTTRNYENNLETLIYFSQIVQAVATKTESEYYRILRGSFANTMGALYWQLNDVWTAPSWSGIEFNGKFKILQFMAKRFFAPTSIIPMIDTADILKFYIVQDRLEDSQKYTAKVRIFSWDSLDVKNETSWNVDVSPNSVQQVDSVELWKVFNDDFKREEHFFQFLLEDASERVISTNYIFPAPIKSASGVSANGFNVGITSNKCDHLVQKVTFEIRTKSPVIFFYMDVLNEAITNFTLSDNGFMILDRITTLQMEFPNVDCRIPPLQMKDIRFYTVNQYF